MNNYSDKKMIDSKKIKDEYKKNIKEKGYSRSIDSNTTKKHTGMNSGNVNYHGMNNSEITNRIKINKTKK